MQSISGNGSPPRLLLVEDDEALRSLLHDSLEMQGLDVTQADCRESAMISLAQNPDINVMLIDLGLPPAQHCTDEGIALIQSITLNNNNAKVIVLTGQDEESAALAAIREGAFDFLAKPALFDDILKSACPATVTSNGLEDITDFGPIPIPRCTLAHGFVPATTLGLQGRVDENGLLLNSWADALRYSVSTIQDSAGYPIFTTTTGMKWVFNNPSLIAVPALPAPQFPGLIRVCNNAACDSIIANNVPAVILARGPNFGRYLTTSLDEAANGGDQHPNAEQILELRTGDGGFVSREYNEESFDDIIAWLSPNILISRMVMAGRLP